jgi:hypothetical protein
VALGAGAVRAVEGEEVGIGVVGRQAAGLALELLGEAELPAAFGPDEDAPFALLQAHLEGVGQALALVDAEGDAVDQDIQGAGLLGRRVEVDHGAGGDGTGESVLFERGQVPFAGPGEGHERSSPLRLFRQLGDHAVDRVPEDRPAALEAVDGPDTGEEDPEEVEDLGHRGHGRARVLGGALLLDGDRRRDALDRIGVGLVHPFEELPGVGGQGFDVAALAFRVERVEGQGGFPGAADPGDHDELIEGNVEVDPLEVVHLHAAEDDAVCRRHGLHRIDHYNMAGGGRHPVLIGLGTQACFRYFPE